MILQESAETEGDAEPTPEEKKVRHLTDQLRQLISRGT
jgi:hypothetical protein